MFLKRIFLVLTLSIFSFSLFSQSNNKQDGIKIGGAVRYNLLSTNYEGGGSKQNPQMTWDTWRLNVDGSLSGVDLSFE